MAERSPKEEIKEAAESKGTETLPPKGWKRDEALKMRQDDLDAEAEELAARLLVGAIDEKYLSIDPHIAYRHSFLEVTDKRDDMAYCWANYINDNGSQVMRKKMLGWETVTGTGTDSPECQDRDIIAADGTRQVGDVLLMRIPRDHAIVLKAQERADSLRRRAQYMNPEYLVELGTRYGLKVHTDLPDELKQTIERRSAARQRQAERTIQGAYRMLGRQLEGGKTLPGVPIS